MVFCKYCQEDVQVETDDTNAISCCTSCGAVLEDVAFSSDVTFLKGADGGSEAVGTFVSDTGTVRGLSVSGMGSSMFGGQGDSHERTCSKGRTEIQYIADTLNIRPRDDLVDAAHRLYRLALQQNFTRGRRTNQVAASCMYIVCREEGRPYMMIDFSDALQVNVFTLGVVFLQLCHLLRLHDHPVITRPVDPSLYIHRFADRLKFGKKMHTVVNTAIRLVASMKRDWMQTGRRPAGICGAALYIAAHIHGFGHSKRDVMRVVHIGDNTLEARITEFAQTKSGSLTINEFNSYALKSKEEQDMLAQRPPQEIPNALALPKSKAPGSSVVSKVGEEDGQTEGGEEDREGYTVCSHMAEHGELHFAHGMCHACFVEYLTVSGGHMREGAEDPPAFQSDEKKKKRGRPRKKPLPELPPAPPTQVKGVKKKLVNQAMIFEMDEALRRSEISRLSAAFADPEEAALADSQQAGGASSNECRELVLAKSIPQPDDLPTASNTAEPTLQSHSHPILELTATGEPQPAEDEDALSELDEEEVDAYLNSTEEAQLKEVIWTHLNQDYLEKQRAKEAAIAAAEKLEEERRAAAALAGKKYEARTKRKYERRVQPTLPEAETAAQAAAQALEGRKLSAKIDYNMLDDLFQEQDAAEDGGDDAELQPTAIAAAWASRREEQEAAETAAEQHHRAALEADSKRAKGGLGGLLGKQLPTFAGEARSGKRVRFAAGSTHADALD